jgi:hypothetical protein
MHGVLPASRAKLTELQAIRIVATILFGGVVSLFAIIALKRNDRANILLL